MHIKVVRHVLKPLKTQELEVEQGVTPHINMPLSIIMLVISVNTLINIMPQPHNVEVVDKQPRMLEAVVPPHINMPLRKQKRAEVGVDILIAKNDDSRDESERVIGLIDNISVKEDFKTSN